jgi:dihydroflavonol-4-reductase
MNLLITGGTGFIGSRLAFRCLERGDSVTVLGQANNSTEEENRKVLESRGAIMHLATVTDREHVSRALKQVDCVYHLAAAQHEANVPDQHFWDVNVEGTRNVLEASVRTGVKHIVHGSTIGVYGASLEGAIDERSALRPNNIYEQTKLAAEKLVLDYKDKLPVSIIRISETYGPGDRRLLKLFKAIKKNVFFIIGNGNNLHHLIYIEDLIEGMFLAASVKEAQGQIFVMAGKEILTTNEMTAIIARQLGVKIPKMHAPIAPFLAAAVVLEAICRPLGIQPPLHRRRMDFFRKSFTFTMDRPEKTLGFLPKKGFIEGVAETVKWYDEMGLL